MRAVSPPPSWMHAVAKAVVGDTAVLRTRRMRAFAAYKAKECLATDAAVLLAGACV